MINQWKIVGSKFCFRGTIPYLSINQFPWAAWCFWLLVTAAGLRDYLFLIYIKLMNHENTNKTLQVKTKKKEKSWIIRLLKQNKPAYHNKFTQFKVYKAATISLLCRLHATDWREGPPRLLCYLFILKINGGLSWFY